jgi:hypothetical protein
MKKRCAIAVLVLLAAISVTLPSPLSSQQTTRFPSARVRKDGDEWLAWQTVERRGFVRGYLVGYKDGHEGGCADAIGFLVPDGTVIRGPDPRAQCINTQSYFPRNSDYYATAITSFYETYPAEREIPLPMMFWLLSNQMDRSPAQIHEWYVNGGNRGRFPEPKN